MAYKDFNPDYSKYTDYSDSYPVEAVIVPANAPILAEDLNEIQEIQKNRTKALRSALYTDGYIHTGTTKLWDNGTVNIDGYVLVSGDFYRVKTSKTIPSWNNGSRYISLGFFEGTISSETNIKSLEGKTLINYLKDNLFKKEVSKRKAVSAEMIVRNSEFPPGGKSILILGVDSNGDVVYEAPDPTFNGYAKAENVIDMRPGITFSRYDGGIKPTHQDSKMLYKVSTGNNSELYFSKDLRIWNEGDISSISPVNKFSFANGYMFAMNESKDSIFVSIDGHSWSRASFISNLTDFVAIPVGENKANVFYTTASLGTIRCGVLYETENGWEKTSDGQEPAALFSMYEVSIKKCFMLSQNDICIIAYGVSGWYAILFSCDSEKLIYNKSFMLINQLVPFGPRVTTLNIGVASDFLGCKNPKRTLWYAVPNESIVRFICMDDEGSTDMNSAPPAYEFSANWDDNPQIYVCNDIYILKEKDGVYACKIDNNCDFTQKTRLARADALYFEPVYSKCYGGVLVPIDNRIRVLSAEDLSSKENFATEDFDLDSICHITDKYGRLYRIWRTYYKTSCVYNVSRLLENGKWGEAHSFPVSVNEAPELNYIDHAIYICNGKETYVSGEVREVE